MNRSNPSLKPTSGRSPLRVRGCKQYGIRSPKQGWVAGRSSVWFAARLNESDRKFLGPPPPFKTHL